MLVTHTTHSLTLGEQSGRQPSVFIPTVYEKDEPQAARWEYHVLSIDPREEDLPGSDRLNSLGRDGWLLVGILDERATGRGEHVIYYFMRQLSE
ncbi:MAG: hypothetical protein J2P37_32365 [Ktedonobacteraceae bacterium]|nr:hypothetical protein [Ktedonobacteraceae bacterium]MBO0794223.1 hypothetical protein [Ktedonobacteraceae bacterium]